MGDSQQSQGLSVGRHSQGWMAGYSTARVTGSDIQNRTCFIGSPDKGVADFMRWRPEGRGGTRGAPESRPELSADEPLDESACSRARSFLAYGEARPVTLSEMAGRRGIERRGRLARVGLDSCCCSRPGYIFSKLYGYTLGSAEVKGQK